MNKNEQFFNNKTYKEILENLHFGEHLKNLEKKFKNRKVIIYGAGILFDYICENYNLKNLNIVAIADKKFEMTPAANYKGYRAINPEQLKSEDFDILLIANNYPVKIKQFLETVVFKKEKKPKIYFMLNKPLSLYVEEIF